MPNQTNQDKRERIASVCKIATYRATHSNKDGFQKEAADWDWGNLKDSISDFWTSEAKPYLKENRGKLTRAGIGGLGGYALSKLLGGSGLGSAAMAAGGAGLGYGSGAIRKWLAPYFGYGSGEQDPEEVSQNPNAKSQDNNAENKTTADTPDQSMGGGTKQPIKKQNREPESSRNPSNETEKRANEVTRSSHPLWTDKTPTQTKILSKLHKVYPNDSLEELKARKGVMHYKGGVNNLSLPLETNKTPKQTQAITRLHKLFPDKSMEQLKNKYRDLGYLSLPGRTGVEGYDSKEALRSAIESGRSPMRDRLRLDLMNRIRQVYPHKHINELRDMAARLEN